MRVARTISRGGGTNKNYLENLSCKGYSSTVRSTRNNTFKNNFNFAIKIWRNSVGTGTKLRVE